MRKMVSLLSCLLTFILVVTTLPTNVLGQTQHKTNYPFLLLPAYQPVVEPDVDFVRGFHKNYSIDAFQMQPSGGFSVLQMDSFPNYYQPGKPIVPADTFTIPLKQHESIAYVKATAVKASELTIPDIPLLTTQEPLPIEELEPVSYQDLLPTSVSPSVKTTTASDFSSVFPASNVQYTISGNQEGREAVVTAFPVYVFNGNVYVVESMSLEVGYTTNSEFTTGTVQKKSVILAPDEFKAEAKKLRSLQEEDGFQVTLAFLSDMNSYNEAEQPKYPGVNGFLDVTTATRQRVSSYDYHLAFKIRTYLTELLENDAIDYLTILGDASMVPPSYYVVSPDQMNSYDMWVPTDLYYVSPRGENVDLPMEIAVGRLSVRDREEAKAVVLKQERYRAALQEDPSWAQNAAIMAGAPFGENFMGELTTSRSINLDYFSSLNTSKYYRTENSFTKDTFLEVLEKGNNGFLWAFGHGSGEGLALEPGYANAKDLLAIPKQDELPIVFSEACGNGAWDTVLASAPFKNNTDYAYPTSFSEAIVLSEGAGIAYVGGARVNYAGWHMEYENGIANLISVHYMDAILEYFMRGYAEEQSGTLGDWANKALYYYSKDQLQWGMNAGNVKTFFGFTLQGDPTISFVNEVREDIYTTPVIQKIEGQPMDYRGWPLFSMDDGQSIHVETDADELRCVIASYSNMDEPFVKETSLDGNASGFLFDAKDPDKKTYTVRFETPDKKEKRIVYNARHNYDVVLQPSAEFHLLRDGETSSRYTIVRNDGIYPAIDCKLTAEVNGDIIKEQMFPHIPVLSHQIFTYNLEDLEMGNQKVQIEAIPSETDTSPSDNLVESMLDLEEKAILRIGVLVGNSIVGNDYANRALDFNSLNEYFAEQELSFEICPVFLQEYPNGITSFESFGFDIIMLYTNNFSPTSSLQITQAALERFSANGGVVFGILSLGRDSNGRSIQTIQSFFGVDPEENQFLLYRTANTEISLECEGDVLPQESYHLQNRYTVVPKGKNWYGIDLMDDTEMVAIDKDGFTAVLRNGNRWLYTGFFSQTDFQEIPETKEFFIDLLKTMQNKEPEVLVKGASITPSIPIESEEVFAEVQIVNTGMKTIQKGTVRVADSEVSFSNLFPRETRIITVPVVNNEVGKHTEKVVVKSFEDTHSGNNEQTLIYYVEKKKVTVKPVVSVAEVRMEQKECRIIGSVEPSYATIQIDDQIYNTNTDGSFIIMLDQTAGMEVELLPVLDDVTGEPVQVPLEWHEDVFIIMQLDNYQAASQEGRINLSQPPQIVNNYPVFPLRDVVETLGGSVSWDAISQSVKVEKEDKVVLLKLNQKEIEVNGETVALKQSPVNINGTTMVNMDVFSALMEMEVVYDDASKEFYFESTVKLEPNTEENDSKLAITLDSEEEPEEKTPIIAQREAYPMMNPVCFDVLEGDYYIATASGIFQKTNDEYEKILEYPTSIFQEHPDFVQSMNTVNQMFFRIHEKYIVLTLPTTIYIIDRDSETVLHRIERVCSTHYLNPIQQFQSIVDVEIYKDNLYLLDIAYGFRVFSLETGLLVTSLYYPNNLYSFEIENDTIIACSYWGYLITYSIIDTQLKEYELPIGYCYRVFVQNESNIYIVTLRNPAIMYHFDLTDMDNADISEVTTDTGYDIIEQLSFEEDGIVALAYQYNRKNKVALKTSLLTLNDAFELENDWLESLAKEASKDDTYVSSITGLYRIPETPFLAIEQGMPGSDQYIRLLNVDTQEIKSVYLRTYDPLYDYIYDTYWFQNKYSVVYYNNLERKFYFSQFEIDERGRKEEVVEEALQIRGSFYPVQMAANEDGFCVYEGNSSCLCWFNYEGKLEDVTMLESGYEEVQIPTIISEMTSNYKGEMCIYDALSKAVFTFDEVGFLKVDYLHMLPASSSVSSLLYEKNLSYALDYTNSTIYSITDCIMDAVSSSDIGNIDLISCFWMSEEECYVYDGKTGSLLEVEHSSAGIEEQELSITVQPEQLELRIQPNHSSGTNYIGVNILGSYESIEFSFSEDIQLTFNSYSYNKSSKDYSFIIAFEISGEEVYKEATEKHITIIVDGQEIVIPVLVETAYPTWNFIDQNQFGFQDQCIYTCFPAPTISSDHFWLQYGSIQKIFGFPTEMSEKGLLTVTTPKGRFIGTADDESFWFVGNDGEEKVIEQPLVRKNGKNFEIDLYPVLKRTGGIVEYNDQDHSLTIEGWNLVFNS